MQIFNDSQKPFYRFSETIFLGKIARKDWIPFIINGFSKTGKSISEEYADEICTRTECHSWYLQQLSYFVWSDTIGEVTKDIMSRAFRRIIDTNATMFMSDVEKLTASQREMLKAIIAEALEVSDPIFRVWFTEKYMV